MNTTRTLAILGIFATLGCDMAQPTKNEAAKPEERASPPQLDSKSVRTADGKTFRHQGVEMAEFFSWDFENWQPDNLHWSAPASAYVATDGSITIYAYALENQRQFDGHSYNFQLTLTYYRNDDCTGPVIHVWNQNLATLGPKQVIKPFNLVTRDNGIPGIVGTARCAMASRRIN